MSSSESSASSATPKPASQNEKPSGRSILNYIVWFFKLALLAMCFALLGFLGREFYRWFADKGEGERTSDEIAALVLLVIGSISILSTVIAIYFEHHCTLLVILIVLLTNVALVVYKISRKENYDDLKDVDFIVFCALTGTFMVYLLILCFFR